MEVLPNHGAKTMAEQTQMQQLLTALKALGLEPKAAKKSKAKKAKGTGRKKLTDEERAAYMAKNDAECIAKFEAAGFKGVKPRVNVLTYDKWIATGRKVKAGEKSTKVGPFRLFHESQTEPLTVIAPDTKTANAVAA